MALKDAVLCRAEVPEEGFYTTKQWASMTQKSVEIVQRTFNAAIEEKRAVMKMFKVKQGAYTRATPHYRMLP